MRTIHKFEISQGKFDLPLGGDWKILHVDVQGDTPFVWIEHNTSIVKQWVKFGVYGTGWDLDTLSLDDEYGYHVGTYLQGPWVWHLYQIVKKDW